MKPEEPEIAAPSGDEEHNNDVSAFTFNVKDNFEVTKKKRRTLAELKEELAEELRKQKMVSSYQIEY